MTHITQEMLSNAIRAQADQFDTHDIVRFLYTNHQGAYLDELMLHRNARYPFTETHRQLGQTMSRMAELVHKVHKVHSGKTMRANRTIVQKWRRQGRPGTKRST